MLKINKVDSTKIYTRQEATKAMGISNDSFSKYFANSNAQLAQVGKRVKYSGELLNQHIDQITSQHQHVKLTDLLGDKITKVTDDGISAIISDLSVISCTVVGRDDYEPVASLKTLQNCYTGAQVNSEILMKFAKLNSFKGWVVRKLFKNPSTIRVVGYSWFCVKFVNHRLVVLLVPTIIENLFDDLEHYYPISREQVEDTLSLFNDDDGIKRKYLQTVRRGLSTYYNKYNQIVKVQMRLYELANDIKLHDFNEIVDAQLNDIQFDINFIDTKLSEC